jgi:hypothetical protein
VSTAQGREATNKWFCIAFTEEKPGANLVNPQNNWVQKAGQERDRTDYRGRVRVQITHMPGRLSRPKPIIDFISRYVLESDQVSALEAIAHDHHAMRHLICLRHFLASWMNKLFSFEMDDLAETRTPAEFESLTALDHSHITWIDHRERQPKMEDSWVRQDSGLKIQRWAHTHKPLENNSDITPYDLDFLAFHDWAKPTKWFQEKKPR